MWIPILVTLAIIVVIFLVIVAMQPGDFQVSRSTTIAAPPAIVFDQLNDFHNWEAWSPWAKMDPNARNTFEGAPAGTGAIFSWVGNNKVGAGRMTITDSRPPELIRINLAFEKPFKATNIAEYTFKPQGSQTQVTWTMSGKKNFICKAFMIFMNMDKMVGSDFEKGLAGIKSIAEGKAKNL